ncbi:MAG TPA: XrtN system VIT domain-containing protein, partial [Chitinophagaceae bacterium]|nr:XrtN system VIT domain-containing protein [Chitinophagaceae bacterium]
MPSSNNLYKNTHYLTGLVLVLVSFVVYSCPLWLPVPEEELGLLFLFNYTTAVAYLILFLIRRKKMEKFRNACYFLSLVLFLISAYSLNRQMNVFDQSVNWLSGILVLSSINYILLLPNYYRLPTWALHTSTFFAGISTLLFLYLSIYLLPLYLLGVVGILALGLSLHVFLPLVFSMSTFSFIRRLASEQKTIWYSYLGGMLVPIVIAAVFVTQWNSTKNIINHTYLNGKNGDIPAWVKTAQVIPNNPIAEKLLKAGIVYATPDNIFTGILGFSSRSFDEVKKHDPLVVCAAFFSGETHLSEEDRVKILKGLFNKRHQAEERLWSGDDLQTTNVQTSVRLWPVCNIAYTETTITVHNANDKSSWGGNPQEGIFTFYLPEGGVVTSLSLWINGKEEKAVLTTKGKADSAYKKIVGVESRDPSVVHWQEGNRVSLRVFPVLPGESRMFKLGVTAPMGKENGRLVYENIYFDGPEKADAIESVTVDFDQPTEDIGIPTSFVSMSSRSYERKGLYVPGWSISVAEKGLAGCNYNFDGHNYSLKPYHKKLLPAVIDNIYLDVNNTWSENEFKKILSIGGKRNIYIYDDQLVRLLDDNAIPLFRKLKQKQFSLFPIYKIEQPATSLLVTKGNSASCNLEDLENSTYISETRKFLTSGEKIRLFNLDKDLPSHLKTLKEFRVFQYDSGDSDILNHLLMKGMFSGDTEDDNHLIIDKADMVIVKGEGEKLPEGPDHIMRLFAYNHVMKKLGTDLFLSRPIHDDLVKEARQAYVVSPLTSLVVLESAEDYKRFDIEDTGNSLKNASIHSKGAVPEPHEWALIIVGTILVLYVRFGR